MEIHQLENGSIFVNQEAFTKKILEKFNMSESKVVGTPIEKGLILNEQLEVQENIPYRSAVGSLLYLALVSRPDIAFAVKVSSQYLERPTTFSWQLVKRIFRYLKGTVRMGILYCGNEQTILEAFSDSDFAGDVTTRRSTSGYVYKYSGGAISWNSQKQKCVALSTTEAEFVAACQACKELIWLKRLFKDIAKLEETPVLMVDNQSAIKLIKNPEFHKRTKHIDVCFHFIREKFQEGELNVQYIPSEEQTADIFTKALPKPAFERCCSLLGMCDGGNLVNT